MSWFGAAPVDTHTEQDVEEEAGRVAALLKRMRPPAGPLTERWALGIGDIVADTARLPRRLRGAVGFLNRFGGLAISPQALGNWAVMRGDGGIRRVRRVGLGRWRGIGWCCRIRCR